MARSKSLKSETPKIDHPLHDGKDCPKCGKPLCPGLDIQACFPCHAYFLTPYGKEYYANKGKKKSTGKIPELALNHHQLENFE